MANAVAGTCICPLCLEDGAEVREGAKGALYIVCLGCCSQIRTLSRQGRALIAGKLKPGTAPAPSTDKGEAVAAPAAPAPAAAVASPPTKTAPKKEKGSWLTPLSL